MVTEGPGSDFRPEPVPDSGRRRGADSDPATRLARRCAVARRPGRLTRRSLTARPQPWLRPGGFTLVEMMVAIILIGVGLMGLAALSTTVTRAGVQSSTLTTGSSLAQERIERFRLEPYASIVAGGDVRTVDGLAYTRSWTVADNDPAAGLKTVTVTVSWTTRGQTHRTTLSTIRGSR